ncbi:S-adenosyl-L-methionine-dependent tRNA 4-demethylwyosine synthase [Homalodisca vitripennis]|nr:S-adenosyl-L-methionine-dependent tRNA 4-demethylwyosine synthase [Homalodisca vitripennis]
MVISNNPMEIDLVILVAKGEALHDQSSVQEIDDLSKQKRHVKSGEVYSLKLQNKLKSLTEVTVSDISGIDPEETLFELASVENVVLLLLPTHSEGTPPPTAAWFYKWLGESASDFRYDKTSFKNLHYAVFGLGNSSYREHYNVVGTQVDQWLQDLGAQRVLPLALGDEDSLDEDFNKWAKLVVELATAETSSASPVSM